MSAIGRIFLVLNLILSALFLGWASQVLKASDEYRAKYETEVTSKETAIADGEAEASRIQAELDTARGTISSISAERDTLAIQVQGLNTDLTTERQRNASLQGDVTAFSSNIADVNTTIAAVSDAKDRAVADARQAERERDDAVAARMSADTARSGAEDSLDAASMRIAELETMLASSEAIASRLDTQLKVIVDTYNVPIGDVTSQPFVEATVLSVKFSEDFDLVALNVGSNDQVEKGMTFEIWDGGAYKGQVRVENVMPDKCSALVTMSVAGATIAEGDNAATRL